MTLLDDIHALTEYHFTERTSILDRLAQACGLPEYAPPNAPRYRIFDDVGLPITCHICGGNHWIYDDGEFGCDHSRDEEYMMVPFPVRDEKKFEQVSRWGVGSRGSGRVDGNDKTVRHYH